MSETLLLLRMEHENQSKLLQLIEDQVAAADAGAAMDQELLRLACEYFSDYPDRCHHPKEDLVYGLLSQRAPESCAGVRNLIAEHVRLHERTEAFAAALRLMREEPKAAEPAAREVIREFAQRYRQHMRDEEEQFFRLAEKRLLANDWASLDFAIFDRKDPLSEDAAEKHYSTLRQRIVAVARQGATRRSVHEAAKGLRELSGIDSFNDSMKKAVQPFRLAHLAEGGYGLQRDHELLLYLPECSEERAAWCAYCFLCGRGWPWIRQ
jgi:hemerythrin-like domain-containing protein